MFLLNRGCSLKVDSSLTIDGIVATASGLPKEQLQRQKTLPTSGVMLFDPQLYFPIELKDKCKTLFTKLSTYSWFNPAPPEYDSSIINIKTYKENIKTNNIYNHVIFPKTNQEIYDAVKSCIDYQSELDVTHYILPSPLVNDTEDCFSEQIKWINQGIDLSASLNKPKLISLSISEDILLNKPIETNITLQTIIDNLLTYEYVDGFYITLARNSNIQYITETNVISSLLELCYILGHKMRKQVFLNSLDTLGFLGLAVGASSLISGYTNKEKRLHFNDYVDKSGSGPALPHFYSFSFIGDLFSDRDMSKIKKAGLLSLMENDITIHSENLFRALENNIEISKTDWKETNNNVALAKLHRYELLSIKTHEINALDMKSKINYVKTWLEKAEQNISLFESLSKHSSLSEDFSHITIWKDCFNKFIEKYSLQ